MVHPSYVSCLDVCSENSTLLIILRLPIRRPDPSFDVSTEIGVDWWIRNAKALINISHWKPTANDTVTWRRIIEEAKVRVDLNIHEN